MLLDDNVVAQRKAKPRSFASGLRRKEGIEHLFLYFGRNAGAAVTDSDLHAGAKVFGRGSKGGLITVAAGLAGTLRRRVEAVGNQIQKRPCNLLGKRVHLTGVRIKGPLQSDVEAWLLGSRSVIGEIEAIFHEGVDIDRSVLAGTFPRMQQHVLDDRVGALAVLDHLFKIAFQYLRQLVRLLARFLFQRRRLERIVEFVD